MFNLQLRQLVDLQLFYGHSYTDLKQPDSILIQGADDLSAAGPQAFGEGQRSEDDSTAA